MCFAMHFSLRQNPLRLMGNWNHVFLVSLYFKVPKCCLVELFQCLKSSSKMFFLEIEVNILHRKNNSQTLRTRFGLRSQVLKFAEDIQFSQLDVTSTRRIPKIWSMCHVGKPAITFGVCHKEFTFIPLRNTGFETEVILLSRPIIQSLFFCSNTASFEYCSTMYEKMYLKRCPSCFQILNWLQNVFTSEHFEIPI